MASNEEYESFTLIGTATGGPHQVYDDCKNIYGHQVADTDIQLTSALRSQYPEHNLIVVPLLNCNLLGYAEAGHAKAELDLGSEGAIRWRGFLEPSRKGRESNIGEAIRFAKYNYTWLCEKFIVYVARVLPHGEGSPTMVQYILREQGRGEAKGSPSIITDKLIKAIGEWRFSDKQLVWVYDLYWIADKKLCEGLMLTNVKGEEVYRDLGVPWKRGVIFHGPAGNGKTIALKAIMHTLSVRKTPIPTLYVKAAPHTYNISTIFAKARQIAPCLLIFEDIDTIVTAETRSYFFNEVDGLESNDGILMIASTNHLEKLDPGLSHRPSRFDRKYLFPLPDLSERTLYCNYWRHKIRSRADRERETGGGGKPHVDFPEKLCPAMATKMDHFSFAYMKEAFVATVLVILTTGDDADADVRNEMQAWERRDLNNSDGKAWEDDDEDDFHKYEIWRVFVEQVKILRKDVDDATQTLKLKPNTAPEPQMKNSTDVERRRFFSGTHVARRGLGKELGGYSAFDYRSEGRMDGNVDAMPETRWCPVSPLRFSQGQRL